MNVKLCEEISHFSSLFQLSFTHYIKDEMCFGKSNKYCLFLKLIFKFLNVNLCNKNLLQWIERWTLSSPQCLVRTWNTKKINKCNWQSQEHDCILQNTQIRAWGAYLVCFFFSPDGCGKLICWKCTVFNSNEQTVQDHTVANFSVCLVHKPIK